MEVKPQTQTFWVPGRMKAVDTVENIDFTLLISYECKWGMRLVDALPHLIKEHCAMFPLGEKLAAAQAIIHSVFIYS